MNSVLIITRDITFTEQLTNRLTDGRLQYTLAPTPAEGLIRFLSEKFCLIVFDMSQPDRTEKEMLHYMIANSTAPVLLISENSTDEEQAEAYQMGVIGYHHKQVNAYLFATIILSFAGRLTYTAAEKKINVADIYIAGDLVVDLKCYRVLYKDQIIALTPKEFGILLTLMKHPDFVFSKMQLFESIWEHDTAYDIDNTVSCHIRSLRRKLCKAGCSVVLIETVWGFGYRLNIVGKSKEEPS